MKLSDRITRRQMFLVAFGTSQATGGLTSVDLAATRDDSQVVVTASDGSAAPISGADGTVAGVMTAADKAKLDDLSQAVFREFAARSEIPAASIGAAVTHLRTAGHTAAGDGGGAVYARAGAEPAHALKVQSADGAWWELVPGNGGISFVACGGIEGDNAANGAANVAAFDAFIGYAQTLQTGASGTSYRGGATLVFPHGRYHFNSHLNVKATVTIKGPGGAMSRGLREAAVLEFPADSHGIIVHRHTTIDDTTQPSSFYGDGTEIEGLSFLGGGNTGTTGHGIWLRARALVRNCYVREFAENGVNIVGKLGAGGALEGLANSWRIEYVMSEKNGRHGLYTDGDNVNAGYCLAADVRLNGRWGIKDSSFLGNTYLACHSSANGYADSGGNGGGVTSIVEYGGNRYAANVNAAEADLVATTPGTDGRVWIDLGSGGSSASVPTWQASQPQGTYVHGGAYHCDNINARNAFFGCYNEPGQGPVQLLWDANCVGGTMGTLRGFVNGLQINGNEVIGSPVFPNLDSLQDTFFTPDRELELKINTRANEVLRLDADGADETELAYWDESQKTWNIGQHGRFGDTTLRILTTLSTQDFGRSAAPGAGFGYFAEGYFLGGSLAGNSYWQGRYQGVSDAAPTSGDWAQGDIVWNRSASAGGKIGWVCVSGGSPGTWKAFGAIDA